MPVRAVDGRRPTRSRRPKSVTVTVGSDLRITGIRDVDLEAVEILQLVVLVVAKLGVCAAGRLRHETGRQPTP